MNELRLYIAGSSPNSLRAVANLAAGLALRDAGCAAVVQEVIDVFLEPRRALKDGVIVTPSLVILTQGARRVLVGDLSDRIHLVSILNGLGREAPDTPVR